MASSITSSVASNAMYIFFTSFSVLPTRRHGTEGGCVDKALKLEGEINQLAKSLEDNHINRLQEGKCTLDAGIIFIEMVGEMEKVGDHLANIAERAPEIQKHYIKI